MPAIPSDLWDRVEKTLRERLQVKNDAVWEEIWDDVVSTGFLDGLQGSGVDVSLDAVQNLTYPTAKQYFKIHGDLFSEGTTQTDIDVIRAALETNWGNASAFTDSLSRLYDENRLLSIYRAEVHMAQNNASITTAEHAGMGTKTRHAIGDERTCEVCMDYNGETVPIDEPFSDGSYEGHSHPSCFAQDTEVFTEQGWKLFPDVDPDTKIWTLNMSNGSIDIDTQKTQIAYEYNGQMIHVNNSVFDCLVTPDHQMLVKAYKKKAFVFKRADKLCQGDAIPQIGGIHFIETPIRIPSYSGMVYCVEMDHNPVIYVRRNGRPNWAGNCRCVVTFGK